MTHQKVLYGSIWPDGHFFADLETILVLDAAEKAHVLLTIKRYKSETQLFHDFRAGQITFASTSAIQKDVPEAALMYLPYLYCDIRHFGSIWTRGTTPVANKVETRTRTRLGAHLLGYSLIGARDCVSNGTHLADLRNFQSTTMRVDSASVSRYIFEKLGATVLEVPYYDVSRALETGIVSAAENAPFNILALGWDKACRFLSLTEHRYLLNFELVSGPWWQRLSGFERTILTDIFDRHAVEFRCRAATQRDSAVAHMRNQGQISVIELSVEQRNILAKKGADITERFAASHGFSEYIRYIKGKSVSE